jgi:transcriptional regulator with XRE-family HTH domain
VTGAHLYRKSAEIRLRTIVRKEFERCRVVNPRYSLRALARSLGIEHSTLSQLLRGKRTLTWKSIRLIASRLRWSGRAVLKISAGCAPGWDSRTIAARLGLTIDEVNITLTDLCLFGLPENRGE